MKLAPEPAPETPVAPAAEEPPISAASQPVEDILGASAATGGKTTPPAFEPRPVDPDAMLAEARNVSGQILEFYAPQQPEPFYSRGPIPEGQRGGLPNLLSRFLRWISGVR